MVGQDHEQIVRAKPFQRTSDDRIHLDVQILDHGSVRCIGRGVVRGMLRIHRAPHHVRHQIDIAEVVEEDTVGELSEDVRILPLHVIGGQPRLLQELGCRQHAGLECFGVLGHALRVEAAGGTREIRGVGLRFRDRQRRRKRIEIERTDVQHEIRIELLDDRSGTGRAALPT